MKKVVHAALSYAVALAAMLCVCWNPLALQATLLAMAVVYVVVGLPLHLLFGVTLGAGMMYVLACMVLALFAMKVTHWSLFPK